jgi:hypothetical protein
VHGALRATGFILRPPTPHSCALARRMGRSRCSPPSALRPWCLGSLHRGRFRARPPATPHPPTPASLCPAPGPPQFEAELNGTAPPGGQEDFMWGVVLGFLLGILLMFWLWDRSLPDRQRSGVIVGIMLNTLSSMMRHHMGVGGGGVAVPVEEQHHG